MTSFLDALQDIKDTQRIVDAAKTGGLFGALDAHQKMRERQQLRDLAAAAQESVELQRKQLEIERKQAQNNATQSATNTAWLRAAEDAQNLRDVENDLPQAMRETATYGMATVPACIARFRKWLEAFNRQREQDGRRRDTLRQQIASFESQWIKSRDADKQIKSLRTQLIQIETMFAKTAAREHSFNERLSREFPEICEHYGFGRVELAVQKVYELFRKFESATFVSHYGKSEDALMLEMQALTGSSRPSGDRTHAPASAEEGSRMPPARVSNSGKTVSLSATAKTCPLCDAAIYNRSAKGCMQCSCAFPWEEDFRDCVMNACLKAMCLVASVDNALREAEVQYIVGEIKKRGGEEEASALRARIIATCKQLSATGYSEAAKTLVSELLPYKGRPVVNLVLELVQSVAIADGGMGSREKKIVDYLRRNLGRPG